MKQARWRSVLSTLRRTGQDPEDLDILTLGRELGLQREAPGGDVRFRGRVDAEIGHPTARGATDVHDQAGLMAREDGEEGIGEHGWEAVICLAQGVDLLGRGRLEGFEVGREEALGTADIVDQDR